MYGMPKGDTAIATLSDERTREKLHAVVTAHCTPLVPLLLESVYTTQIAGMPLQTAPPLNSGKCKMARRT